MVWRRGVTDLAVVRAAAAAIDAADAVGLDALLAAHPDAVRFSSLSLGSFMHQAARRGHISVMETLWRHGADLDASRQDSARTPLHLAARHGHVAACEWLLARGASVARPTPRDVPVLVHAVLGRSWAVVQALLARGADVNDIYGEPPQTALDVALKLGQHELADQLRDRGQALRAQDVLGRPASPPAAFQARAAALAWLRGQFSTLEQPDSPVVAGITGLLVPASAQRRFETCITWADVPWVAPNGDQVELSLHLRAHDASAEIGLRARWARVLLQLRAGCAGQPGLLAARFPLVALDAAAAPFAAAVLLPRLRSDTLEDQTRLCVLDVIPLHAAEATWAAEHGVPALLQRFQAQDIPTVFDGQRPPARLSLP